MSHSVTLESVLKACEENSRYRNPQLAQTYDPNGPDKFIMLGNYILVLSGIVGMVSDQNDLPVYVTFSQAVMSEKYTLVRVKGLCEYVLRMQDEYTHYMEIKRGAGYGQTSQVQKLEYIRTQLSAVQYTFDLNDEREALRKVAQNDNMICTFLADDENTEVLKVIEKVMN